MCSSRGEEGGLETGRLIPPEEAGRREFLMRGIYTFLRQSCKENKTGGIEVRDDFFPIKNRPAELSQLYSFLYQFARSEIRRKRGIAGEKSGWGDP